MGIQRGSPENEFKVGSLKVRAGFQKRQQTVWQNGTRPGPKQPSARHVDRCPVHAHLPAEWANILASPHQTSTPRWSRRFRPTGRSIRAWMPVSRAGDQRRPNSGEHQELRRIEYTATKNDFARRFGVSSRTLMPAEFHACRARAAHRHAVHGGTRAKSIRFGRFSAGLR